MFSIIVTCPQLIFGNVQVPNTHFIFRSKGGKILLKKSSNFCPSLLSYFLVFFVLLSITKWWKVYLYQSILIHLIIAFSTSRWRNFQNTILLSCFQSSHNLYANRDMSNKASLYHIHYPLALIIFSCNSKYHLIRLCLTKIFATSHISVCQSCFPLYNKN